MTNGHPTSFINTLLFEMKITRRKFTLGSIAALTTFFGGKWVADKLHVKSIPGELTGSSYLNGHKLLSNTFSEPSEIIYKDAVIIGSGIAGLGAGYQLAKAGMTNFVILELENSIGGNSQSRKNDISAYPLGAHYVPLVTDDSIYVRQLFEELNIIVGYDNNKLPIYNEFHICADPHERLYIYGRWQEGILPEIGLSKQDEEQYQRFFSQMLYFRDLKGKDGKKAFAIPVDASSQDPQLLALDNVSMENWMNTQGFDSPTLRWYINYCCRDDYGTLFTEVSAWAGIHYFASRSGQAANTNSQNVLTWPEGNGWLVNKLAQPNTQRIVSNALAYKVTKNSGNIHVDYLDTLHNKSMRIVAKTVVMAVPRFIAAKLLSTDQTAISSDQFSYAPWAVANITLSKLPGGQGAPLSWDNVVYNSELLGYVVATHQIPQMNPVKTVISYYWPLSNLPPSAARKEAMDRTYQEWQQLILKEFLAVHPELEAHIEHIHVHIFGHAMIRPVTGFIWGQQRRMALRQQPPVFFCHSDMSGISIFEEAYTHGVNAANNVLKYLNHRQAV